MKYPKIMHDDGTTPHSHKAFILHVSMENEKLAERPGTGAKLCLFEPPLATLSPLADRFVGTTEKIAGEGVDIWFRVRFTTVNADVFQAKVRRARKGGASASAVAAWVAGRCDAGRGWTYLSHFRDRGHGAK